MILLTALLALNSPALADSPTPTTVKCEVVESLGSSLKDGKYTQQKKYTWTFDANDSNKNDAPNPFQSSLIKGIEASVAIGPGSVGNQANLSISLFLTDKVTGAETTDLMSASVDAKGNFPSTSYWHFYKRANKDAINFTCESNP